MSTPPNAAALTVPGLLAALAQTHPAEVALRHKQYGLWNEVSYAEYLEQVQVTALGLPAKGTIIPSGRMRRTSPLKEPKLNSPTYKLPSGPRAIEVR